GGCSPPRTRTQTPPRGLFLGTSRGALLRWKRDRIARMSKDVSVRTWGEFAKEEPDLAAFGAELLLGAQVAYLATVRPDGVPRVHPVTPILTDEGLFLFMEPTSPKGHDLRSGSGYSMHNAVPDMN